MRTWQMFWYTTGLTIGGAIATGRTVARRFAGPGTPHRPLGSRTPRRQPQGWRLPTVAGAAARGTPDARYSGPAPG